MKEVFNYDRFFLLSLYCLYFDHIGCAGYPNRDARGNYRDIACVQVSLLFRYFQGMIKQFEDIFLFLQNHRYGSPYEIQLPGDFWKYSLQNGRS